MIDDVYILGDDALQNQAELEINPVSSLIDWKNPIKFRTTEFSIPDFNLGTYEVPWKTQKFEKPSGKIESSNEFEFTLRVDKYWTVYQALMAWFSIYGDASTGKMAEDVGAVSGSSVLRTDITVRVVDSNGIITYDGWKIEKAFIKSITGVSFSQDSGDPVTVQVTVSALKIYPV